MSQLKLTWIDPIYLEISDDDSDEMLIKRLRAEIKRAISDQSLKESVYTVRIDGRTVIVYHQEQASPVVYIGRGDSVNRLASHLKRWAAQAFTWGHDVALKIQIIKPEFEDVDAFKYLEADLLRWFHDKFGMLPLINSRFEKSFEGKINYRVEDEKKLRGLLTIGRGKRPYWAIYPLKSNPHFERYYKNY